MKAILKEVLSEIKPTGKEKKEVMNEIDTVLKKINSRLKDAKAELGGSGAKDTWLKGSHDADIFVMFEYGKYKDKSDELSNILEKVLKKDFQIERLHGSRDYFRIKKNSFTMEIVPILAIKKAEKAKNITDVSPLHSNFVKKHKKYTDDIRLAKQFCRAAEVYGAESYISGFSGYVIEILTIYYKGFEKFVRAAAKWKDKEIVDIMKYHKNVHKEINKSKLQSPIIIVDPVDKTRNAAAAISKEKYDLLRKTAKRFVKKPSKEFFKVESVNEGMLRDKYEGKNLIIMKIGCKKGKEDTVGSKVLKVFQFLTKKLEEFEIKEKGWSYDKENKALIWFVTEKKEIDEFETRKGPPKELKEHIQKFKKKYKKTFRQKGRICAKVKRKHTKIRDVISELFKEKYVKEKVKKIKLI